MTGTYTAQTNGLHYLTILNRRSLPPTEDVRNYIDDISLEPATPDLTIDWANISIATGGASTISLDAGPGHNSEHYLLLASFGTFPGFTMDGVAVHLNADVLFNYSLARANTAMFQNSFGTLDASGRGQAVFDTTGPLSPVFLGRTISFAYLLLTAPGTRPVTYASLPVMVNLIP
jgi:hypothetical protein